MTVAGTFSRYESLRAMAGCYHLFLIQQVWRAVQGQDRPSMRRRHFFLIASLLLIAGALGTLLWLRHRALPEAVRLLPESDAVVFVNLKAIRRVAGADMAGGIREPGDEDFIRDTGIDFERDLDEAAFAVHSIGNNEHRYSEIFNGRFDSQKLTDYL